MQLTDDWFQKRLGKVTASRVADVMAKTKTGYSASRANYLAQLVCERLTGARQESYTNAAMQWGIDTEAQAKAAHCFLNNVEIQDVDFVDHPSIVMCGASPDGLIGDDGLIEIKCPNTATHISTLLAGNVDGKYITQMQWQMACTGREWCDFVSFDPRMPHNLQVFKKRIFRDERYIEELESEVALFLDEVSNTILKLSKLGILGVTGYEKI